MTQQVKNYKRAKLIQYQGGGYDGCFWEWNYCLLLDNKFIDLGSTGINGIKNKEQLIKYVRGKWSQFRNKYYTYDLNNPDSCQEFISETNLDHAAPVAARVNDVMGKTVMMLKCSYCEDELEVSQRAHEEYPQYFHDEQNYRGNGGVGIVYDHVICESCYCNRCSKCDSIFHPDDEQVEDERGNSICEHCKPEESEDE